MRYGLLGGSFDPFHNGHLWLVRAALDDAGCDRVWVVPAARPPHKPGLVLAPFEHRLAMCRAALADLERVTVSDCEARREGPSFTIDTLEELAAQVGLGHDWVLVMGADMAADFQTWRDPDGIRARARLAVAARPAGRLPPGLGEVDELPGTPPDVTATDIRRRVAAGEPIVDLVPPGIDGYITAHGLYRPEPP